MANSLALAERNVPRYTSYPTAPHFSPSVGAGVYADWLAALPAAATLSLYIHVPFCTELCHYCGCNTKAVRQREPVETYANQLIKEIALYRPLAGRKVVHLHWGGGTPSILGVERIADIIDKLAAVFDMSALREHAIELDPRRIGATHARALAALGVTRASLGVQEFAAHVQEAMGRIQPFDTVARVVGLLRDAGIEDINFDLMYGLPRQSADDVARTADLAASLEPQRLALFGYAHVPWFKTHQQLIDEATLPGLSERIEQTRVAARKLAEHGYAAIGLDHFAKPDDELAVAAKAHRLHRNFQGYTTDAADALIGLGATAIGRLPQGFVQNAPDLGGYDRAIAAGRFASVKGVAFSAADRLRGTIIERLMCDLEVDAAALARAAGSDADFAAELEAIAPLACEGLLQIEGSRIRISEAGRPYVRLVAAAFDSYLPGNHKRHSIAV